MTKKLKRWKRSIRRAKQRSEKRQAEIEWMDENKFTINYHDKNINELFMPLEVEMIEE